MRSHLPPSFSHATLRSIFPVVRPELRFFFSFIDSTARVPPRLPSSTPSQGNFPGSPTYRRDFIQRSFLLPFLLFRKFSFTPVLVNQTIFFPVSGTPFSLHIPPLLIMTVLPSPILFIFDFLSSTVISPICGLHLTRSPPIQIFLPFAIDSVIFHLLVSMIRAAHHRPFRCLSLSNNFSLSPSFLGSRSWSTPATRNRPSPLLVFSSLRTFALWKLSLHGHNPLTCTFSRTPPLAIAVNRFHIPCILLLSFPRSSLHIYLYNRFFVGSMHASFYPQSPNAPGFFLTSISFFSPQYFRSVHPPQFRMITAYSPLHKHPFVRSLLSFLIAFFCPPSARDCCAANPPPFFFSCFDLRLFFFCVIFFCFPQILPCGLSFRNSSQFSFFGYKRLRQLLYL